MKDERPTRKDKVEAREQGKAVPNEGQAQTRGKESEDGDKFRITVELRQLVLDYFNPGQDPRGIPGPSCVIVGGQHCRLSNISKDGRWIKSERFYYDGKEVVRKAGSSAGSHMLPWRQLRCKSPELFAGISLMAQPAAVVDSIIQGWQLEELGESYPCSICQRDMLGSYRAMCSEQAIQVICMLDAPILGKMTPVLQVTDTDVARPLKLIAAEEKEKLRAELKAKAVKERVQESFVCRAPEVMKVVARSLARLNEKLVKENTILKAMRRNYMLSYRPDFDAGRLVRADSQAWAKDMSEGGHRIKSGWAQDRYGWLQDGGVPQVPDFSRCATAKSLQEMAEYEFCCEEEARVEVGGRCMRHSLPVIWGTTTALGQRTRQVNNSRQTW